MINTVVRARNSDEGIGDNNRVNVFIQTSNEILFMFIKIPLSYHNTLISKLL